MSRFYNLDQAPFNSRELSKAIVAAIAGQYNGAFFDAQDMSTMFQDAAGTVPVTAMEQPVGKWLDKSGKGNHATQSVTASRPVVSARYNLLTNTDPDLAVPTGWGVGFRTGAYSYTLVSGFGNLPPTHKATKQVQSTSGRSFLQQSFTLKPNTTYVFSAYFDLSQSSVTSGNEIVLFTTDFIGLIGTPYKKLSDADSTGRISLTVQTTDDADGLFKIGLGCAADATGTLVFTAMSLYESKLLPYQRVNTATDYDTVGFKKYLKFDGVDDFLNLPYLGLYANGSASIVAARDALSQANDSYVLSERSASNVNPKYFPSRQLANAGNMDAYIVNDAGTVVVDTVGSAYGGASNAVIRSVVDSGNNIKLFKNGALAANDNYTRSGTLTLTNTTIGASVSTTTSNYANMKLYGLAITKSVLSDSERRRVERLLAYNSGAQI